MPPAVHKPAARRWAGLFVLALAACGLGGCPEGNPPHEVISSTGSSRDFLPPGGAVVPGTMRDLGLVYRFDPIPYRLFKPIAGTDPKYIRRDSVLAKAEAANPGAPQSLLLRPDENDPVLQQVYANPRLFGFQASSAANVGFVEGRSVTEASRYLPVQTSNWWEHNHAGTEWTIIDSIVGSGSAPTGAGLPVYHLRTTATARADLGYAYYRPERYVADIYGTSAPGEGLLFHSWTIVSERDVAPELRGGPNGQPDRQRNPRFLWLSIQSLDINRDPTASPPVTIDQCLDALPSHLELFPLRLAADRIQEGEIYRTWTYLKVDDDDLRQRLNEEAGVPQSRCGFDIVTGTDTLRMFPTRSFKLLTLFEVRVERVVDQLRLEQSDGTIQGLYPRTPSPGAVVGFLVTMYVGLTPDLLTPAQRMELYYLRDIGEVHRVSGVFVDRRARARLRQCQVDNVFYPPDNPVFFYSP